MPLIEKISTPQSSNYRNVPTYPLGLVTDPLGSPEHVSVTTGLN